VECVLDVQVNEVQAMEESSAPHTLQIPHAALHSSEVAETWLAWQSMPEMNEKAQRQHTPSA
jgi:hypothetical protein